jgi:hypothetical protein
LLIVAVIFYLIGLADSVVFKGEGQGNNLIAKTAGTWRADSKSWDHCVQISMGKPNFGGRSVHPFTWLRIVTGIFT